MLLLMVSVKPKTPQVRWGRGSTVLNKHNSGGRGRSETLSENISNEQQRPFEVGPATLSGQFVVAPVMLSMGANREPTGNQRASQYLLLSIWMSNNPLHCPKVQLPQENDKREKKVTS